MGEKTDIQWAGGTWNPVRARNKATGKLGWFCIKVSPACKNCYVEPFNRWVGTGVDYRAQDRDKVELFLDEKILTAPLRRRKPNLYFLTSTTDVFADFVSDEWLVRIFAVMALAQRHTFQVLTKRSARMHKLLSDPDFWEEVAAAGKVLADEWGIPRAEVPEVRLSKPLPNVWLGVSVEDRRRAAERIPDLLATLAAVRFLSMEPLLELVDLTSIDVGDCVHSPLIGRVAVEGRGTAQALRLDWVIVGLESGVNSRVGDIEVVRDVLRQCVAAGVPAFTKQLGRKCRMSRRDATWAIATGAAYEAGVVTFEHEKGGNPDEWPPDVRVLKMPEVRHAA